VADLTPQEAADRLGMPVRMLERLAIHKCPEGYAREVIDDFARRHHIPRADSHVIEVDEDWHEALWRANADTVALIGPPPPPEVYGAIAGAIVIAVGEQTRHADWCADSWQEARTHIEEFHARDTPPRTG